MSFAVRTHASDEKSLSLQVNPFDTMLWEGAWGTVSAFSEAQPDRAGYLAERIPGEIIAQSFYADKSMDFPEERAIVNDDGRIAPTAALEIESNQVVGMYYVSSYRMGYEYPFPAYVDGVVYKEFAKDEVIELTSCQVTPRITSWAERTITGETRERTFPSSIDVWCEKGVSSFNWLIIRAETSFICRYTAGPGSSYYDAQGYLHLRATELTEPFYYIINLNIEAPREEGGKSE
jgi:hypothetical protein